jgi:general secretion pathway protein H
MALTIRKAVKAPMPISVAGISIPDLPFFQLMNASVKSQHRSRGFTILEILVVVGVISVIASTILLNTNLSRPETKIKNHASTVGKTLQLLLQEAILEDKNYALSLVPDGYLILEYDGSEWLPSKDKYLLKLQKRHDFEDELIIDNSIISVEKTDKPLPHILMLASGEMSVFQWNIADQQNDLRIRITSSMLGKILIEGPAQSLL